MGFSKGEVEKLKRGSTEFALKLFRKISASKTGGNVFFSPASITQALAMVYLGARKDTAKQMSKVLGFSGLNPKHLHASLCELRETLTSTDDCVVNLANRLYVKEGYPLKEEFVNATRKYYATDCETVDFNDEETCQIINAWVEKQTRNKITNVIQPGALSALTRLLLINAVYFKGDWNTQFNASNTKDMAFRLADGGSVMVPMMYKQARFCYGISKKYDGVKAVMLPYVADKLGFLAILPKEPEDISELENKLNVDDILNYNSAFKTQSGPTIKVHLPRFKLEDTFNLSGTLSALGMDSLFSMPSADLSGISEREGVFVEAMMHKSFIEVNEEGSEAAASTFLICGGGCPGDCNFKADRPFLFFIIDNDADTILFMGKYAKP